MRRPIETENASPSPRASIIKPGLLVALRTTARGGVRYEREDISKDEQRAEWRTVRTIEDPAEYDASRRARSKASAIVRSVCSATSFGLLCPTDREAALDVAIAQARALCDAHNAGATSTHASIYVLKGRIASSDEEAVRAVGTEVASLVATMSAAIDRLDPAAVRDAANRAREVASMLSAEQEEQLSAAIKQARAAARLIVSRVEKKGEAAKVVLADVQRGALEKARIAFLQFGDEAEESTSVPVEAAPVFEARIAGVDLGDDEPAAATQPLTFIVPKDSWKPMNDAEKAS